MIHLFNSHFYNYSDIFKIYSLIKQPTHDGLLLYSARFLPTKIYAMMKEEQIDINTPNIAKIK